MVSGQPLPEVVPPPLLIQQALQALHAYFSTHMSNKDGNPTIDSLSQYPPLPNSTHIKTSTQTQATTRMDDQQAATPNASLLKPNLANTQPPIPIKSVNIINGELHVVWKSLEVKQLIKQQNLQYTVLGRFSYGKPDIHELCKVLATECEIKGECNVGLIENRHVLINLSLLKDYSKRLSTPTYYMKVQN